MCCVKFCYFCIIYDVEYEIGLVVVVFCFFCRILIVWYMYLVKEKGKEEIRYYYLYLIVYVEYCNIVRCY